MSDDGGLVNLTQNELTQALAQRIILAVVSSIRVNDDPETGPSASGGSLDFYEWQPSKPLLTFMEFQKSVEGVNITSTFQIRPKSCPFLILLNG